MEHRRKTRKHRQTRARLLTVRRAMRDAWSAMTETERAALRAIGQTETQTQTGDK